MKFLGFFATLASLLGREAIAVAPSAARLAPAAVMIGSGVALYFVNRSNALDLGLMAAFAASGAFVASQVYAAIKP